MGVPNLPDPNRIDPQSPAEAPPGVPLPERPVSPSPEFAPAPPDTDSPGPRPGEWQPLDFMWAPFRMWCNLVLDAWPLTSADRARCNDHHDLPIPEPLAQSGDHALFA
jgi:hypothetical protein